MYWKISSALMACIIIALMALVWTEPEAYSPFIIHRNARDPKTIERYIFSA